MGGYRLVYIREAQQYYFLFAGTHDDCDHWLTHHENVALEMPEAPTSSRGPTNGGGDARGGGDYAVPSQTTWIMTILS